MGVAATSPPVFQVTNTVGRAVVAEHVTEVLAPVAIFTSADTIASFLKFHPGSGKVKIKKILLDTSFLQRK